MPVTLRETNRIKCFAAEVAHPVLSMNDSDVQCQISGRLLPAEGSPCCNEYTECRIWRATKDVEAADRRVSSGRELVSPRKPHVLRGVQRDTIQA